MSEDSLTPVSDTAKAANDRKFHTLDGLRGVAALLVVARHLYQFGVYAPESFLAVDLFFLLSGFVIANAYDERLSTGDFAARFAILRLIRLYPLYLLALLVGITAVSLFYPEKITPLALVFAIFMVPTMNSTFDGPTWTLPFELLGNLLYALFYKYLSRASLLLLVIIGAAGLLWSGFVFGKLDAGGSLFDLPVGLSRVSYSFFGGALMYRLIGDQRRTSSTMAWLCLIALGLFLIVRPHDHIVYELTLILFVLPTIVYAGCRWEPANGRLFAFLGVTSYGVYVLHSPLGMFTVRALNDLGINPHQKYLLAIFIGALLAIVWASDKWYDVPVRRWLQTITKLPARVPAPGIAGVPASDAFR